MHDDTIKEYQREEIRDCHEGIHAVGYVPHYSKIGNTAGKDGHDIEQAVGVSPSLALDIFHRTLTIISPSENSTEGEGEQTET